MGLLTASRLKRGKGAGGEGGRSARCYQSITDPRGQKQLLSLSAWPSCGQCKTTALHIWVPTQRGLDTGVKRCQSFWLVCVLSSTLVLGYFLLRNKATKAPKGLLLPWPVNGKTILTIPENGYLTQTQGPVGTCQAWLGLDKNLEMMSRLGLHLVMSIDSTVRVSVYT